MTNEQMANLSLVTRHASLVLTGFMGTGKTRVGKIVAQKLGREFVDMDRLIEQRETKSVRDIFETCGEEYFRARESELCAELGMREKLVVATGGGALLNDPNRKLFAKAFVVCLDANADEILSRLKDARNRPLVASNPRERVQELLKARRVAYAQIEHHVDTTGKSAEAVADEIVQLFREAVE